MTIKRCHRSRARKWRHSEAAGLAKADQSMTPFLNAFDVIRAIPTAKRFEIGEMLFAQFDCPVQDEPLKIWSQTDHLVHVVSARSTWKTSMGMCSAEAGESIF